MVSGIVSGSLLYVTSTSGTYNTVTNTAKILTDTPIIFVLLLISHDLLRNSIHLALHNEIYFFLNTLKTTAEIGHVVVGYSFFLKALCSLGSLEKARFCSIAISNLLFS